MLKMADNPPLLSPAVTSLTQLGGTWWVAHTKARREKAFAWDLLRHDIGYFLPMRQKITISTRRKRKVMAPLFSSYVFFCGSEQDRYAALLTDRLCATIPVVDQQGLVRELATIEKALAAQVVLDPYPFAAAGRRCRITAGAMMNVEGVVVERTKKARIVLQVSMLGQSVSTEVDGDLLEPLD